jgi:hypothetical protein
VQVPQFALSDCVLTQAPLHIVVPGLQIAWQVPETQA